MRPTSELAWDWFTYYQDELGWVVVPGHAQEKRPLWKWKSYQTQRLTEVEQQKAKREVAGGACLCVVTGSLSGLVVLDCDDAEAEERWREALGEELWGAAWRVRTKRGVHIYGRVAEGKAAGRGGSGEKWDFRAEGGIVVAPPADGREWERGPWDGPGIDAEELVRVVLAGRGTKGQKRAEEGGVGADTPTTFAALMKTPPEGEGSGRNVWLSQVAGHLAVWIPFRDAFDAGVRAVNAGLSAPLPAREVDKMIVSIWETEQAKGAAESREVPEELSEDAGWAYGLDSRIWVRVLVGKGEDRRAELQPWSDFDLRALSVTEEETGDRFYDCELKRARDGRRLRVLLSHRDLTDGRRLSTWLGGWGVTVVDPPGCDRLRETVRLQRYLEAQKPRQFQVSDHLGDQADGSFLTWDGVIGPDGERGAWQGIRPSPVLESHARVRYGFEGSEEEALEVLREVMGYQDERVAAVYGAWWMACLLKGRVMREVSQFPVMVVEAPSESGKTTGFFRFMHELAGGDGPMVPTRATFRDALAASRNTPVWIDDADDLEQYEELVRAATAEGVFSKMGEDRRTGMSFRLRAPLLITGEVGLDVGQKALADRSIRLDVPPGVSKRTSLRPGREGRPQWDDILEMGSRGSLSRMAGWLVARAKRYETDERVPDCKPRGDVGRFGDKLALLHWGAHALDWLLGDESRSVTASVESWEVQQGYDSRDNSLTTKVLPTLLARTGWKAEPEVGERNLPPTPVFVRGSDDRVLFSPKLCAEWWAEVHRGRVDKRTETAEALEQQARALGAGGTRHVDRIQVRLRDQLGRASSKRVFYWMLDEELSEVVVERSRGMTR